MAIDVIGLDSATDRIDQESTNRSPLLGVATNLNSGDGVSLRRKPGGPDNSPSSSGGDVIAGRRLTLRLTNPPETRTGFRKL